MKIFVHSTVYMTALLVPWIVGGCPGGGGGGGNGSLVANAGVDQGVAPGAPVTLDGSASTSPSGATLTFSWTQTAGTTVTLSGADTAKATFTAPNQEGRLTFELTVNDGTTTDTASVNVDVHVTTAATPLLFITTLGGNAVLAYDVSNVNNINGNIAPSANLSGAKTKLALPIDVVVDAAGSLLVANTKSGATSITTYFNAADLSGINGNVAPSRDVEGSATTLTSPTSLAIVASDDILFVSNGTPAQVLVFAGVSTSGFNGNMAPIRTFTSTDVTGPIGINLGANDTLYVANEKAGGGSIAVFDNASTLNGAVAATRVITSTAFSATVLDVFIDVANDRMFVLDEGNKQVHVFNNASTINGPTSPDVTLTVDGANALTAIAVDSKGIGYIADELNNAVYSYDNIANRNGKLPPDRTLKGSNTQLVGPGRLFLRE